MATIKKLIKKYFESLVYFYGYLKYRVFLILILSLLIAFLDGLGLTMFLPLLTMISDGKTTRSEGDENMNFLIEFLNNSSIDLTLFVVLMIMAFFFLLKGIVVYFFEIYKVNIQQLFITKIRLSNLSGLNKLSYKYFITADPGRIQNTMTGEVDRVARAFLTYFTAFQAGIMVIVYMLFAFTIDAKFAVLVSVGGLLTNFIFKAIYTKTKNNSRKLTGESNIFQNLIIQNVSNYKYLKATGSLKMYSSKLRASILKIENSNKKIGKLGGFLTASREPVVILVVVLVIYIQTTLLGSPLGPILISLLFFYRALNFLMQMQNQWNKFLAVSGSMDNMTLFGQELKSNGQKNAKYKIEEDIKSLKLNKAFFSYGTSTVLNGIDLEIKKNETIAFVGESGSGKTTIVNLISGLLPVTQGEFLVNNINAEEINLDHFQKKIGYITQDPVIFNDTVYNNVTFWAEKSVENIKRFTNAIEKAAINEYILNLDSKEETILGGSGTNLSGGQKQRISIARELFKDVEILILDEATSALDSETEKLIQKNIEELQGNYTLIIVAHRISTIKNADRIVIMKNGKIERWGSFYQLVEQSDYFKKMVSLQEL